MGKGEGAGGTGKTLTTEHYIRELFLDLDVNGDGQLSLRELRNGLKESSVNWLSCGLNPDTSFERLWKAADEDGDMKVTFEEFWRMISKERSPAEAELAKVREMFIKLDTTKDGLLHRGEIQAGLRNPDIDWESLGIDRNTYDRHIFLAADTDGNNRISFDEFWQFVLKSVQRVHHEQAVAASKQVSLVDVSSWGMKEVGDWITEIGFPQYRTCFEANSFHGPKLLRLTMDVLPRMNITNFDHMKEIMRALRRLKGQREDAVETLADHYTQKQYAPPRVKTDGRTLRFGTASDFAQERATIDGNYSKPTLVMETRF
mmetsp:Transcript_40978/g.49730  ORF Transcript_40978/g.49730 Transcript_40978/m.49730 type:complete len:316 (-) Transcript_40978:314-1261(-)|eukprot:CAMPEP_0197851208 /NCGR_PEP_ID=MMETSP1438-20131217/17534_1 /TAXON_ID=1461541 /ORGANISM="Pterosperma sp., Strain CCMP1384" /LENGTH=315 /DNA_ID=CAMNT_0043464733 /DNA_START=183 /DNA_END=1130 /DNA_ORIENTATION=+